MASSAGTARRRPFFHSVSRQCATKTITLTVSPSRLDRRTPSKGPAMRTSSGAQTSAKPMPVTRWVSAPAMTPRGRKSSPVVMSTDPGMRLFRSEAEGQVADVFELLEPEGGTLAAQSGLLDAAHGREGHRREGVVDA